MSKQATFADLMEPFNNFKDKKVEMNLNGSKLQVTMKMLGAVPYDKLITLQEGLEGVKIDGGKADLTAEQANFIVREMWPVLVLEVNPVELKKVDRVLKLPFQVTTPLVIAVLEHFGEVASAEVDKKK